ncbi:bifunctional ADP-dependent NAD(P)H-hydrate dehydratase/NAD(P)H-hydrate epimerase [Pseudonocardia eucalypti]|uniref:Bifunctional NAD(P)H-hydrate repair enzyme n=2 Tax=Pseudonocardia eucalypti TaxID=648755 RepID=A0ABP9PID3_9PSEU
MWGADRIRAAEDVLLARTPEGALMRRAAHGVGRYAADLLREHTGGVAGRRVTLLVGAGNNGGDALWAGYELRRGGARVTAVLLAPDRAHPAGLAAFRRVRGRVLTGDSAGAGIGRAPDGDTAGDAVAGAHLVIDGIVGISGRGALRPAAAELVARAEAAGVPILAVDLPSGVDPDTGAVDGPAVTATATVTFGGRKPVHALAPHHCGPVRLVDIGLAPHLPDPDLYQLEAADVAARWPVPGPADDKYTQGVVGIAAGSAVYPGAAVLATGAAVAATSGMVRFAGGAADQVRSRWPEVVAAGSVADTGRVQAWTVGPGIGTGGTGRDVLASVLDAGLPCCLDADAITLIGADPNLADAAYELPAVYTPHDREFARLTGAEVGPDRVGAARAAAAKLRATVLLKGNVTVVAAPDGRALANPAGSSWAATAGSGDVLSGLIGALLAAGLDPWWAAGCAAFVHARAAQIAAGPPPGIPIGASALLAAIPEAIRQTRTP